MQVPPRAKLQPQQKLRPGAQSARAGTKAKPPFRQQAAPIAQLFDTLASVMAQAERSEPDVGVPSPAAATQRPQSDDLPAGEPPEVGQAADCASAQPSCPPAATADVAAVKPEPAQPVACGLQLSDSAPAAEQPVGLQPAGGDIPHKRQTSSMGRAEGQLPACKRQCSLSPSIGSKGGPMPDETAPAYCDGQRLLPGYHRFVESVQPEAVALITAHCIDAHTQHTLLAR